MSGFGRLVEAEIPRLRRYARALARDPDRADDLVQSCIARALSKQHLWQPGTDLRAWLFTILHNQHVSEFRRSVR
jgi:RNA polymerase sigma-70 factor, ECF subfamily